MMRASMIAGIRSRLSTSVPEVMTVDLWRQQTLYAEEEEPLALPAVLVEFAPIGWAALSGGARRGEAKVSLHVVTACGDDCSEAFDLADRVTEAVLYLRGDGWVLANHAQSATQAEHAELTDCTETFDARFLRPGV